MSYNQLLQSFGGQIWCIINISQRCRFLPSNNSLWFCVLIGDNAAERCYAMAEPDERLHFYGCFAAELSLYQEAASSTFCPASKRATAAAYVELRVRER
ncbi:hypothetical protein LWI29_030150 [Acer saccharum]|uniref:Uncharacterized protein n=1 Tax=Acer saccharum TaxID=4024 RepID=A0AA39W3B3_ACESA|nr:hypothetical protein LWI29_030150 [Acer saccharum]